MQGNRPTSTPGSHGVRGYGKKATTDVLDPVSSVPEFSIPPKYTLSETEMHLARDRHPEERAANDPDL